MSTATPDRAEVLALVRSSPGYVAAHDKAGWLGIFAEQHVVEDPVGWRPVRSDVPGALARFWDAFIAPNDIVFEVAQDWVDGYDVVRDVTIASTLPTGVQVRTPAHLIYQTTDDNGTLKVRRMAAHWEPTANARQLLRPTGAHVRGAVGQSVHMMRTLGVGPSLQFFGGIRSVGKRGKRVVLEALAAKGITDVPKIIASGHVVTASFTLDDAPAAVIAELDPRSRTLRDLRIYDDPA